eukprot:TRINITY_DN2733_c0_g1_i1.p1 TRINITY_DN2733_c0_g1~~TRINITY_DN2733_c0_g1_i1.p1  ORF type:complete len:259 (+),score=50.86 TRINITY_DN2733_c0_g1_i1:79-777(+)
MSRRSARAVRSLVGLVLLGLAGHWVGGPSYAVKGSWLGAPTTLRREEADTILKALEARRQLPANAALRYSVENPVGVYDLEKSTHVGEIFVPVADGEAKLKMVYEDSAPKYQGSYTREVQGGQADVRVSHQDGAVGYDVSYKRDLSDVLPVTSSMHVGASDEAVYGKITARRSVNADLDAEYEAIGRVQLGAEDKKAELAHALKLSNKLGYAQLSHGSSESPRLRVGYEFNV